MKNLIQLSCPLVGLILVFFQNPVQAQGETSSYYTVDDFKSVNKMDTHVHIYTEDASLVRQAAEDNFHVIDINGYMYPGAPPVEEQQSLSLQHIRDFPAQMDYITSISVTNFNDDDWQEKTIAYLKNSFAQGAVGVKVWKNIGMELKDKNGKIVMIDDPKFDPILDFIAENGITLFSHQGEPKDCWLPLDKMILSRGYFSRNPQYHMYLHPDYPTYEEQIAARDHMIAKHPDLKVVSVHLASLEWSVDEIAKRLDRYPNMAVDVSARVNYLQYQAVTDWQKVRDFFLKYQDRILYGSDITINRDDKDPADIRRRVHRKWVNDWKFFTTDDEMTTRGIEGKFKGLKLPRKVIDKLYWKNMEKWMLRLRQE